MATFLEQLGLSLPIIQAPMAGVSTPELAAAVSNAGGLGSIALGASNLATARAMIADLRARSDCAFNLNVFVHSAPVHDSARESAWLAALAPHFQAFGASAPSSLGEIYPSFQYDDALFELLLEAKPPVISFHFGLPSPDRIDALKKAGAFLLASVTNREEAMLAKQVGIDALVAQGIEAGGHRGTFDPNGRDECLSTLVLTRLLVREFDLPVIAAGGIMDGFGIAAALKLGAVAAQLGTAFIACPESSAAAAHRAALLSRDEARTAMTRAISGWPARCLVNRFTAFGEEHADLVPPDYPLTYDAGKALHAAASAKGEYGYGAYWAGQGVSLARALPASELMQLLASELQVALA
jgi:nitronate monooxygenase